MFYSPELISNRSAKYQTYTGVKRPAPEAASYFSHTWMYVGELKLVRPMRAKKDKEKQVGELKRDRALHFHSQTITRLNK